MRTTKFSLANLLLNKNHYPDPHRDVTFDKRGAELLGPWLCGRCGHPVIWSVIGSHRFAWFHAALAPLDMVRDVKQELDRMIQVTS